MAEPQPDDTTFSEALDSALESFGELARLHVVLFKAETTRDLKAMARGLAPLVVASALVAFSYVLLVIAGSFALGDHLGNASGFAVFGALHLVAGVALASAVLRRWRTREPKKSTFVAEIAKSARVVTAAKTHGGADGG